jgi:PAS domain S-box-containing protein
MTPHGNRSTETSLAQLAALDRVMAIAEFTPDGTVLHANRNYQSLLGYADEEIRGRHHRTFCPPLVRSPAYAEFWAFLSDGASRSGIEERVRRNGSSCWLEATYTPVFDARAGGAGAEDRHRHHGAPATATRPAGAPALLSLVADASDTAASSATRMPASPMSTPASRGCSAGARRSAGRNPVELLAPQLDAQSIAELHAELYGGRSLQREDRGRQAGSATGPRSSATRSSTPTAAGKHGVAC